MITTNEFTPVEVKEIAAQALAEYKRLHLINLAKHPRKALHTVADQPQLITKYLKNLLK
jgi:hypothetical protein